MESNSSMKIIAGAFFSASSNAEGRKEHRYNMKYNLFNEQYIEREPF